MKALAERLQCLRDCSWVMPEIVDDFNATSFAAKLLPARNPRTTAECACDLVRRHIIDPSSGRRHCGVMHIEFANERNFDNIRSQFESRSIGRIRHVPNSLRAVLRETSLDHLRQAIFGDLN